MCAAGGDKPQCLLCSNRGGALKRVRPGNTNWAHLSCALWIPEIRLGNADKMEPITNVDAVPVSGCGCVTDHNELILCMQNEKKCTSVAILLVDCKCIVCLHLQFVIWCHMYTPFLHSSVDGI